MERLSYNLFRRATQTAESPSGVLRVAVTEGVGTYWVMPKLIEFQGTYRLLTVDLRCAMEQADVARLEADIVSKGYARIYGLPTSVADVQKHGIVQQVAPQLDESAYARALGVESVAGIVGIRTNSSTATL